MKTIHRVLKSSFFIAGALIIILSQLSIADIPTEDQLRINEALPETAIVSPENPGKILVMTLHMRKNEAMRGHASIPYGTYAIKAMGDKTGAYQAFFSNDTMMFKKENLKNFDAICFLNTAGVLVQDAELRQNILDFVKSGKGFIGIHAAAATFVQWPVYDQFPAFGEMLGAYEDGGHPWKPDETIYLKVEEPEHPLTDMFPSESFPIQDEVFQFRAPYSRNDLRILLSIDVDLTDMNPERRFLPERFEDKDFAISWIRSYGKGRVFYSSLGHNSHIYWNSPVLEHFLAGIQYALGDLEANATPSAAQR